MIATRVDINPARLLTRIRSGDPLAIARALSAIENATPSGVDLGIAVRGAGAGCKTLGVTGPPGAGKSSLVSALIEPLRDRHSRIGVLTVDPSSPVSGGAILGDRVRMTAHSRNPNIFIRSLATRGHLGGVTRTTRTAIDLLATAGFDLVIVETVGTGQSEVEVAGITDVRLVVCPPGLGDDMQAIKAGVLEIADLLVVNKADLPDAARTAGHLRAMLHHRGHEETRRVLLASATTGEGLATLADSILAAFPTSNRALPADKSSVMSPVDQLAADAENLIGAFIRYDQSAELTAIRSTIDGGRIPPRDAAIAAIGVFMSNHGN